MSGTIGVVASDTARYTLFSVCLGQLQHPPNTRLDWALSTDIAGARNTLVERSLEVGSEWMLFLDDDHAFPSDLLNRLLAHDRDFVCSLYLRRAQPFAPVCFSGKDEETGLYDSISLAETPSEGLVRVHACGGAGMLVKSEVFRAIEKPWFEHGRVDEWNASEDIIFCEKANAAGFEIFLDPEAKLGHMAPSSIWPSWIDDRWAVGFTVADGLRLYADIVE
jgi:GT2 family glycosyltransferase